MRDLDVLLAGTVFCDLVFAGVAVPAPGTEVHARSFEVAAGGVANRAVASARLGARTALVSAVGRDELGEVVMTRLAAEPGLDLGLLRRPDGWRTPVTVAMTDADDRAFCTYLEDLPGEDLWPGDDVRVGITNAYLHDLPAWAVAARARGTVLVAGVGWDGTGEWATSTLDQLAHCDVFVPNEVEAERYTRTTGAAAAAAALAERVEVVVVTRGAGGVLALDAGTGRVVDLPGLPVDAVDPTGAGDVFTGALLASHRHGWDLADRLRLAVLASAVSVTRLGGASAAPGPAALLAHLRAHRPPGDWHVVEDWLVDATS